MADQIFRFSDLSPELQLCVFEQFDRQTLHSAVQVSKKWFEMSTPLLWEDPSTGRITNLASMQSKERRQYYANKIKILVPERLSALSAFDKLVFPALRVLWLDLLRIPSTGFQLLPYLQPKLDSLCLHGCDLDLQSLDSIVSRCPVITTLDLCGPLGKVSEADFANFVRSLACLRKLFLRSSFSVSATNRMLKANMDNLAPRLESLTLWHFADSLDPEPFRMFISNCRSLQNLSLAGHCCQNLITGSLLVHVLEENPLLRLAGDWLGPRLLNQMPVSSQPVQSFRKLQSLRKWGCSSGAISVLQQVSNQLRVLELCFVNITAKLFPTIARQRQLKSLTLCPLMHRMLSFTHLSVLSSLKSLEFLEITYRYANIGASRIHGLDDGAFAQLIPNFANLRILIIDAFGLKLGAASIKALSQACPLLECCALLYPHDLSTWTPDQMTSSFTFPSLWSLYLGEVAEFMAANSPGLVSARARLCAKMLLNCTPDLQNFGIETFTWSGASLLDALTKERPVKPLGAGDVAEVPITTSVGRFCYANANFPVYTV